MAGAMRCSFVGLGMRGFPSSPFPSPLRGEGSASAENATFHLIYTEEARFNEDRPGSGRSSPRRGEGVGVSLVSLGMLREGSLPALPSRPQVSGVDPARRTDRAALFPLAWMTLCVPHRAT